MLIEYDKFARKNVVGRLEEVGLLMLGLDDKKI